MIKFIKNLFKKKEPKPEIKRSEFFPEKFYSNRMIAIDDSIKLFIKNAHTNFPDQFLIVHDINSFSILDDFSNEPSKFEEILFTDKKYKLIYDSTADIFYLLENQYTATESNMINYPQLHFKNKVTGLLDITFDEFVDLMEIKERNELLKIFNREISSEADEYLFVEANKNLTESYWTGIILQPNLIN